MCQVALLANRNGVAQAPPPICGEAETALEPTCCDGTHRKSTIGAYIYIYTYMWQIGMVPHIHIHIYVAYIHIHIHIYVAHILYVPHIHIYVAHIL